MMDKHDELPRANLSYCLAERHSPSQPEPEACVGSLEHKLPLHTATDVEAPKIWTLVLETADSGNRGPEQLLQSLQMPMHGVE